MVGFGSYHYTYASGREGDTFLTSFAPRKRNLTLYIMAGFDAYDDVEKRSAFLIGRTAAPFFTLGRLGKHKTGKSCLCINQIEDVDLDALREMIRRSVDHMRATNG